MNEASANIERIAMNLTAFEFEGYCKGMSLHWFFKAIDKGKNSQHENKRVKFW